MRVSLLADSCTTGWLHWGHGELWLTPEHLVRIGRRELTLRAAAKGGALGGAAVAAGVLGLRAVSAAEKALDEGRLRPGDSVEVENDLWAREVGRHPQRTLVLSRELMTEADLKTGIITSRLNLEMVDGRRHKLLWSVNEHAASLLTEAFGPRLRRS
ncbi:hypothetical protein [Arthrobacter sp. B0490]|uniref:hypothetical protein n=1 Tax=Arthrobacter sp. B0490 TaxID=2058891 RepID=UPI000CE41EA5|nr:hypothetical protein [Arthrobacter sp. B0490]